MKAINLLLIEDDEEDKLIFTTMLNKIKNNRYEIEWVPNSSHAGDYINKGTYDLVIMDYHLGKYNALDIMRQTIKKDYFVPIIILTGQKDEDAHIEVIKEGAAGYLLKEEITPFMLERTISYAIENARLRNELAVKIQDLKRFIQEIKTLHGILPICAYCKKIRNDKNYWEQVEKYISDHSNADFSHSICPECYEKHVVPDLMQLKNNDLKNKSNI